MKLRSRSHNLVIGMYENSSKVKCREAMCDVFQWIAELKDSKPRSCVNFAEIVCRFRLVRASRDRVSISPGDRLGYVGDRLRFGKSSPRWRIVGEREVIVEEVEEDRRRVVE